MNSPANESEAPRQRRGRSVALLLVVLAITGIALAGGVYLLRKPPTDLDGTSRNNPAAAATGKEGAQVSLRDATDEAGIKFVHTHGGSGRMYIMEAMTAGMATFDYDGDGLIDVYFLNGAPLQGTQTPKTPPHNALYRNLGNWRFQDVTDQAGVGIPGFGLGVAAADFDNDGDTDLYVNNYGPNVLYRNNGDGTFAAVGQQAGITDGDTVGAGACFVDIDGDGNADLYSANYVKFSYDKHPERVVGGFRRAPSPLDFDPEPDALFRNSGDGTFADVSESSGIRARSGKGMGMVSGDFDNDGDSDIFVCNDVMENFYWKNDGTGKFEEIAQLVGVAYDFWGKANGSMGSDCADYDNDGWLDIFMTDYQAEMPALYRNLGKGMFEDVAMKAGVGNACMPHVNWGNSFLDIDCDGDRDLFVGNGHLEPMIHSIDDTTDYKLVNVLFMNVGGGQFLDISTSAGAGMNVKESTRGTCADDLDNDGDVDLAMLNQEARPTLLKNETHHSNHWLQLRLIGTRSNRDAVGARVRVVAGDLSQIDEVHSGRSYQSHSGLRLHFGLRDKPRADRIEVKWLGGKTETFPAAAADQLVTLVEGTGQSAQP
jgi:hypothetical protein